MKEIGNDEMIKISLITTMYNSVAFLEDYFDGFCKNNIEGQIELIIVDDGSADDTYKELKEYNKRINFFLMKNEKNYGLSYSRNRALEIARGEYIFFLDVDDWLDRGSFKYMFALIHEFSKVDIFIFENRRALNYEIQDLQIEQEKYLYGGYTHFLLYHQIGACVKLYKRDVFKDISFFEKIFYEDLYLQSSLASVENLCVLNTRTMLYNYRINPNSIIESQFTQKKYDDYILCFESLKKSVSHSLYEFSVLRATRHLLRQAKNSEEGIIYYEDLINQYKKSNNINRSNPFFDLWLQKEVTEEVKYHIYSLIDEDIVLYDYLLLKNIIKQEKNSRITNNRNESFWKKIKRKLN